jgi:hypothetical protein
MGHQKRTGGQADPQSEQRGLPLQIKAPWFFEATLKQEVNRRKFRRDRNQRIFKGVMRIGVPALGVVGLAIVAVAGFRNEEPSIRIPAPQPTPSVQTTAPPAPVEKKTRSVVSEKPKTPTPVTKRRSVPARAPEAETAIEESGREEDQPGSPEVVAPMTVTAPLERPEPPALSLPPADTVTPATIGDTTAEDSTGPALSATGRRDSTQVPADTARAGTDSSEVREQHSPSSHPDR